MNDIKNNLIEFADIIIDVFFRFLYAVTNFTFLVSFSLGMLVIGGLGIWIDMYNSNDYTMNIFTYSTVMIGTLLLNGLTSKNNNTALALLGTAIGMGSIILLVVGLDKKELVYLHWGTGLSLLLYAFVESNKDKYKAKPNTSPTGNEQPSIEDLNDA